MNWEVLGFIVNAVGMIGLPLGAYALSRGEKTREETKEQTAERVKANAAEHAVLHERITELRQYAERLNAAFSALQLDTAQRYATILAMREMDDRWQKGLTRLEDKLDRVLTHRGDH